MLSNSFTTTATNPLTNRGLSSNVPGARRNLLASPESIYRDVADTSNNKSMSCPIKSGNREHQRRAGHTHAEQKRRYNIKNGFDQLRDLIPQLQHSNTKVNYFQQQYL